MSTKTTKQEVAQLKDDTIEFIKNWFVVKTVDGQASVILPDDEDGEEFLEEAKENGYEYNEFMGPTFSTTNILVANFNPFNYDWMMDNGEHANVVALHPTGYLLASCESGFDSEEGYEYCDLERLLEMKEVLESL